MKLESLKTDKFESFKENEILNKVGIVGGLVQPVATCLNGHDDTRDYDTQTSGQTDGGGTPWDFRVLN